MKKTSENLNLDFLALKKYFYWQERPNSRVSTHPKFSRRFIKPIRIYLYGLIAKALVKPVSSDASCDVLILHRSQKTRKVGLRNNLISRLRQQGLNVIETQTEKNKFILKKRLLCTPPVKVPISFWFYACYAHYIVKKYNPKIILSESNGSEFSSFLKAFLPEESSLIHIAHCVTTDNYRHYSLIEYDYYFLYGQSSLDKLRRRNTLFGSTKVVLTGPYIAHQGFTLEPRSANKNILLFGVNPNMEKRKHIQKMYDVIKDWINQHNDYQLFVKMHPRSQLDFWKEAQSDCSNIHIVKKGITMQQALSEISLTLGIYTNAVLDAALLNRPSLLVCDEDIEDELDIEHFFLNRCKNTTDLQHNIEKILKNYPYYLKKTTAFAKYHLEHQENSVDFIVQCVDSISHDQEPFPIEHLQGIPFSLQPK